MKFSLLSSTAVLILVGAPSTVRKGAEGATSVQKAKWGETVVLPCPSDDKLHRFQYWLLKNDQIIGPWNNREENRVRYEVWSGRLIIQKVSEEESGLYKCISKKIIGSEVKSETVELLVLRDWEDSFENDTQVNVYRALVAILILLTVLFIAIFLFCKRRSRSLTFLGAPKGDSSRDTDQIVNNDVYRSTSVSLKTPPRLLTVSNPRTDREATERLLDTATVETDISSSFPLPPAEP